MTKHKLEKVAAVVALAAAALVADVELRRLHKLRVQVATQQRWIEQQVNQKQRFSSVTQEHAAALDEMEQRKQGMNSRAQARSNADWG